MTEQPHHSHIKAGHSARHAPTAMSAALERLRKLQEDARKKQHELVKEIPK